MLRMSTLFLRTLRDDPADAEVPSHRLLVRAGYIRRIAAGVYSWLPLGVITLRNIENIVRQEMDKAGFQEVHFPALLPKDAYETTGRWNDYGPDLFRLQDRRGADYLLGPTHEEMFTLMVKGEYSSYKDLPLALYQIQTKYRDEARPRSGIIRGREFVMKDSYSFDLTDEGLVESYLRHRDAYIATFDRLRLKYNIVSAVSGAMGGSASEEFLAPCETGEDTYVLCEKCGYAANVEAMTTVIAPSDASGIPALEVFDSPNTPTIDTLVELLNAKFGGGYDGSMTLKNVMLMADEKAISVLVPGDREVDLKRLQANLAGVNDSPVIIDRAIEIGHIFQLGRKYAQALNLTVLDQNGKSQVVTMGSYGIGVSRAVAAIAEQSYDEIGLSWPVEVAPAKVHLVATGKEDAVFDAAEKLAADLESRGISVMLDDRRGTSPGVKFKDAELIGIPVIVVVGKALEAGNVEVRVRKTGDKSEVSVASAADEIAKTLATLP